jgi:hypothetical protein
MVASMLNVDQCQSEPGHRGIVRQRGDAPHLAGLIQSSWDHWDH